MSQKMNWIFDCLRRFWQVGLLLICMQMLTACVNAGLKPDATALNERLENWTQRDFKHAISGGEIQNRSEQGWWLQMQLPELNIWIQTALENNTDLRASLSRLMQARAQAGVAQASRMPVVYGSMSSSQTNGGSQAMNLMGTTNGTIRDQLNIQMSYEFDFWNKREFSIESALHQVQSNEYGVESYKLSLIAEVAANYFKAVSLRERLALNQKMMSMARKNSLDIKRKLELGEATQVMLSQQLIFEQGLMTQSQDLQIQLEQSLNQLSYLIGSHGQALPSISHDLTSVALPKPDVVKPAELLCRRPDLKQAEADLMAANADVAVARTLLLPGTAINLNAGQIGAGLAGLTSGPNVFLQSALSASQLIFDGGARRQAISVSEARRTELIERYAGAVLAALRDTESALVGVQKTTEKLTWLESNRAEAQRLALQMQVMLERGGLDFAQLIQIQTTVYNAEDAAVSGALERILTQIDLYKALGGSPKQGSQDCLKIRSRS